MSEYQYYEFVAVDRPLTDEERAALRQITSRALITPWRLQNVYNWGNFKGDPLELMERYFDLFVYVANWGSRQFMVRLPRRVLPASDAAPYDGYDALDVLTRGEHVILDMHRIDEDGGGWIEDEEAESWVPALLPLRADLAAGDLRALYIAWLAGVSLEDMDREATEPPVPAGLREPTAGLEALAQFLGVDRDLLEAAAETSPALAEAPPPEALRTWLHGLAEEEKDDVLERLVVGNDPHLRAELLRRYRAAQTPPQGSEAPRRLVGDILDRAAALREARSGADEGVIAPDRSNIPVPDATEQREDINLEREGTYLYGNWDAATPQVGGGVGHGEGEPTVSEDAAYDRPPPQIVVTPEMGRPTVVAASLEVEEDAPRACPVQPRVNPVIQVGHPPAGLGRQHALQLGQDSFAARQLEERLLLLDHRVVFSRDAAQRVEVARSDHLAQHAGIEEAGLVDHIDLGGQAADEPEEVLEPLFGKHVEDR